MKLLMLSTDKTILDPQSRSAERMRGYGQATGDLVVVVIGTHGGRGRVGQFIRSYRAAIREARRMRPEVITAQDPFWTGLIAWRAARSCGAGLHLQLHGDFFGSSFWSRMLWGRLKLVLGRFLLRRADAVRVVSERVKKSIVSFVPEDRIAVAPIPFDVQDFGSRRLQPASASPATRLPRLAQHGGQEAGGYPTILYVGRLEDEKGVDVLLGAFAELRDPLARLVIVGDGGERRALEDLARRLGLADRVTFAGAQTNLGTFYAQATVCVIPSRTESWGRVALEALAADCPLVMTDVGLVGEIVRDGESGLVVPTEDPKAFAEAMGKVLSNEALRAELVAGGRKALARLDPPEISIKKIIASWEQARLPIIMITQTADPEDQNLGFVAEWVHALQACVPVKLVEFRGLGPIGLIRLIMRLAPRSRGVFAHMCPEYAIVAAPIAHWFGRPTLLWYTHKSVTWRLRLAALLVDRIFTASKESCRIRSQKIEVVGHGIMLNDKYQISNVKFGEVGPLKILAVGRLSPVKDFETVIRAVNKCNQDALGISLTIVGEHYLPKDEAYAKSLRGLAGQGIGFSGPRPHIEMKDVYGAVDLLVHTSRTGSMDKVVLEALACGIPVVSSSIAFKDLLPREAQFPEGDVDALAKILHTREALSLDWQPIFARVREEHNLERLADRIANFFRV